ncbi:unnamed protein product [Bathycoccus prasinos]
MKPSKWRIQFETEEEDTLDASSPKPMIQRDPSLPTSPSRKRKGFVVGAGGGGGGRAMDKLDEKKTRRIPFLTALETKNLEFNAQHATRECLRHFGLPVVLKDRKRMKRRNNTSNTTNTTNRNEKKSGKNTTELTLSEIRGNVKWGWAREATKTGVKEAKRGHFMIALKAFDRAIELDSKHVDAYVARGAVLAKNTDSKKMTVSRRVECLEEARRDFRLALEMEEGHEDAEKYLEKVEEELLELREKLEKQRVPVVVATKRKISAATRISSSGVLPADRARLEQREKDEDRIEITNNGINKNGNGNGILTNTQKNALEEDKEMTEFLEAEIEAEMARKEKEKHRKEKKKRKRKKKEKKSKHKKKKSRKKSSSSSESASSSSSSSSTSSSSS